MLPKLDGPEKRLSEKNIVRPNRLSKIAEFRQAVPTRMIAFLGLPRIVLNRSRMAISVPELGRGGQPPRCELVGRRVLRRLRSFVSTPLLD